MEYPYIYPEQVLTDVRKMARKHTHQFTIPVEWATEETSHSYFNEWWVIRRFVTKLMCSCGKEKERK